MTRAPAFITAAVVFGAAISLAASARGETLADLCYVLGELGEHMVEGRDLGMTKSDGLAIIMDANASARLTTAAITMLDEAYDWPLDARSFRAVIEASCMGAAG